MSNMPRRQRKVCKMARALIRGTLIKLARKPRLTPSLVRSLSPPMTKVQSLHLSLKTCATLSFALAMALPRMVADVMAWYAITIHRPSKTTNGVANKKGKKQVWETFLARNTVTVWMFKVASAISALLHHRFFIFSNLFLH